MGPPPPPPGVGKGILQCTRISSGGGGQHYSHSLNAKDPRISLDISQSPLPQTSLRICCLSSHMYKVIALPTDETCLSALCIDCDSLFD